MLESSVRRAVLDYAKVRYHALTRKLSIQGAMGNAGWPDDMILGEKAMAGTATIPVIFFIEFKRPGNKLTPLQEATKKEIEGRGFHYYIVFTIESGKKVIDEELG